MRTNITYYMSSEEKIYIKDGTNIYELKDFPQKEFELCWKSLQNRNHEDIDNNLIPLRESLIKFLNSIGAFNVVRSIEEQLNNVGLNGSGKFSNFTVGVCGDQDLVKYYCKQYHTTYNIIEIKTFTENFDFGLILSRDSNVKQYLQYNRKLYSTGKVFDSLLFSQFSFLIGPHTVPKYTSCIECMRLHEVDNNFYGNILTEFDKIDIDSQEFIPELMLNLGLSFYEIQVLKQILSDRKDAVEVENSQKVLSYQLLEGIWEEHHLLKHPTCSCCFPREMTNKQIFEVNVNGN